MRGEQQMEGKSRHGYGGVLGVPLAGDEAPLRWWVGCQRGGLSASIGTRSSLSVSNRHQPRNP